MGKKQADAGKSCIRHAFSGLPQLNCCSFLFFEVLVAKHQPLAELVDDDGLFARDLLGK